MAARISLSDRKPDLNKIWDWYEDQKVALKQFEDDVHDPLKMSMRIPDKFRKLSPDQLKEYFTWGREELDQLFSFDIISATEGLLRRDFYEKVQEKRKSDVARRFRKIHKEKGNKISLERDILHTWKDKEPAYKILFNELVSLLKYRHWLAHGRYWEPKFGQPYNTSTSYKISKKIFNFVDSRRD
jgi:hypothetical protein